MSTTLSLPHWDMTVVFPSLESPEFDRAFNDLVHGIEALGQLFDEFHIGKAEEPATNAATVETFEKVIRALNDRVDELNTMMAYIHSFITTDSRNDLAQAKMSELQPSLVRFTQLITRFTAWVGSLDVEQLIELSAVARQYAFLLRQARTSAQHLMSPDLEDLAAELEVTGGSAWTKLHGNITSQLMVPIEVNGTVEDQPMSVVRNMAFDPDRSVREKAYRAEIATWEREAVPLAAALNSIKGETLTLDHRRHWPSPLDEAVFNNNIDRQTLDAMMQAARESFPDFRRYLHAKARALGLPKLAWYDLFAPIGKTEQEWAWDDAVGFMLEQFGTYSDRLRSFGERAFRERWIDAEPRPGKRDGAFCMSLRRDESRILSNFRPTYDGMSTLAHELGHAYHNLNLSEQPPMLRDHPMTLAETASTFLETTVRKAALESGSPNDQLVILEAELQDACQIVVDITSRFLFESWVFDRRDQRELSVEEFNELMLESQRQTYGDGLDSGTLHPYMWAVKGHYYGANFYNFPYMFGLLFGTGLYSQYQQDPDRFRAGYDRLLASTGTANAADLAAEFGIDIRTPEFWRSSLDVFRRDIDQFEQLVDERTASQ